MSSSLFSSSLYSSSTNSSSSVPESSSDDGIPLWVYIVIPFISFIGELVDSSLGMGYGTTLVPILMTPAFKLERKTIVQSVLVSELCTGVLATVFHLLFKNVNCGFDPTKYLPKGLVKALRLDKNYTEEVKKELEQEGLTEEALDALVDEYNEPDPNAKDKDVQLDSRASSPDSIDVNIEEQLPGLMRVYAKCKVKFTKDMQVVLLLVLFGIIGTVISTIINAKYAWSSKQKFAIKLYVAIMVLAMGVIILVFTAVKIITKYRGWKIAILGIITGFNKGISGGGYGPIAVSGQMICGRPQKNAIAATSTSEAIISLAGVICSCASNAIQGKENKKYYSLVPYLIIGSCLSTPFAAYLTRLVKTKMLRYIVGVLTTLLGIYSILAAVLSYKGIWSGAE